MTIIFNNIYSGKRVLITGHTGFKGAWLTCWLLKMNALVSGLSIGIPTQPSMFEELGLEKRIDHHICDVRNLDEVQSLIAKLNPEFIFHLAAQPLVSVSFSDPLDTITTNVVGTSIILEALRNINHDCVAIIITSDKCYENLEWVWGYKESDPMGGNDIYSASKGAAEIIFKAYYHAFFNKPEARVKLATARAGNVIGGGDWAKDRIVADCMRSWSSGDSVEIRRPASTRPWQHVLEPLSGYLLLGIALYEGRELTGESFNFGPKSEQNKTVLELLHDLSGFWSFVSTNEAYRVSDESTYHEAGLLKLNCDKALFFLKWQGNLEYFECVRMVSEWYKKFYSGGENMYRLTIDQIAEYEKLGLERGLSWSR